MFWMIVTRFFCKTEILRDFPCTLKAGIFKKKKFSPFIKKRIFFFFITLERSNTRKDKFECILEIIESSPFVKAEADLVEYFVVFETVCASSLAICAYQTSEHLHLTFADHLDLYSQQANPNFRFPSIV
jgi:hypothetical protein